MTRWTDAVNRLVASASAVFSCMTMLAATNSLGIQSLLVSGAGMVACFVARKQCDRVPLVPKDQRHQFPSSVLARWLAVLLVPQVLILGVVLYQWLS